VTTIRGAFPGGPTRTGSGRGTSGHLHLATVEETEHARMGRLAHRARARRKTRRAAGGALVCFAALAAGALLGWATRRSREDLVTEARQDHTMDRFISKEVNRTLLELWKMESAEGLPRAGRIR
jgi:hypothetical protein